MSADKFVELDLPKIMAALKMARESGAKGSVIIQFDQSGGVLSVVHEAKRTFK